MIHFFRILQQTSISISQVAAAMWKHCVLSMVLLGCMTRISGAAGSYCTIVNITEPQNPEQLPSVWCGINPLHEVERFFSQDLPTRNFSQLSLFSTEAYPDRTSLTNIFNGASFEVINIISPDLKTIASDAFADSKARLQMLFLSSTSASIRNVAALIGPHTTDVQLRYDGWGAPPTMDCATVGLKVPDDFLYYIQASPAKLLSPGFLKYCSSKKTVLSMEGASVGSLDADTFYVGDLDGALLQLQMSGGTLTSIQKGFINTQALNEGTTVKIDLDFRKNFITDIPEKVFRNYFDMDNMKMKVDLSDNPLSCDCGFAWLVRNTTYLHQLSPATCTDGRQVQGLTPQDFVHC